MSERPRVGSSVPPRGDEAIDGPEQKKRGESDPLFDPTGLKRRSTFMGMAPAPHLGGASGALGARALSEEEARRQQRLRERFDKTIAGPHGPGASAPPSGAPASVAPGPASTAPSAVASASVAPASVAPAYGTTTMLMVPRTPNIPLSLPKQPVAADAELPSSAGWNVAQPVEERPSHGSIPSAPPAFVDPRQPASRPSGTVPHYAPVSADVPAARAHADAERAVHAQHGALDPPPTERMVRSTTQAMVPFRAPAPPPAGTPLRRWEQDPRPSGAPGPTDARLVLLTDPDSTAADAYRVLRDRLVAKSLPRVVAVSSPLPRDGKTTCAINLALALSEQPSNRVLLVDGNFFEPELSRIFQMDKLPMLAPPEAEAWLPPYRLVQVTASLHLVGVLEGERPRRRFEQHRFEAMIDRLCRANYDFIVVDAPALHEAPAVVQLLAVADATLFAVRAGGPTTARELRRAAEQIPKDKALGVALIDA